MVALVQSATAATTTLNALTATLPAPPADGHTIVAVHLSRTGQVDTTGWTVARQHMLGIPQGITAGARVTVMIRTAVGGDPAAVTVALAEGATAVHALWVGTYDAPLAADGSTATATWTSVPGALEFSLGRTPCTRAASSVVIGAYGSLGAATIASVDGLTLRDTSTAGAGSTGATLAVADTFLTDHGEPAATFTTAAAMRCLGVLATLSASPQIDRGVHHATVGAVTHTGFTVATRTAGQLPVRIATSTNPDMTNPTWHGPATPDANGYAKVSVTGLTPGSTVHWRVEYDGHLDPTKPGKLRTFPTSGNFRFAHSGCAMYRDNGTEAVQGPVSEHLVFDVIRDYDPDFFQHNGDFHYMDIEGASAPAYRDALDHVLESPRQAGVWRSIPWLYTWDDHDFGANDSNRLNPGRAANREAYRTIVPHYPLPFAGPVHQRADITDKARYLMLDGRSDADDSGTAHYDGKTKLGAEGLAWLKDQVRQARQDGIWLLIIQVGTPWISVDPGDNWYAYRGERQEIANYIHDLGMQHNVVMTAGDGHMLAIDDGTNNAWGGWPVFQAAALDRGGSIKGGPYSEGAYANQNMASGWGGHGQFGTFEVTDNGDSLAVAWEGIRVMPWGEPQTMIAHTFTVGAPPAPLDPVTPPADSGSRRKLLMLL